MAAKFRGSDAEDTAVRFLEAQGLRLIERNYRCRMGELDIIMKDQEQLVFVEVRQRTRTDFGHPVETLTVQKQRKLMRAAEHYLLRQSPLPPCRFDVIAISGTEQKIEWVKNAFQAG